MPLSCHKDRSETVRERERETEREMPNDALAVVLNVRACFHKPRGEHVAVKRPLARSSAVPNLSIFVLDN